MSTTAIAIAAYNLRQSGRFLVEAPAGLSSVDVVAGAIIGPRLHDLDIPATDGLIPTVGLGPVALGVAAHLIRDVALDGPEVVEVLYLNHAGVNAWRHIVPGRVWFGATPWHATPQHLLQVWDLERDALRDYALENIQRWRPQRDHVAAS